MLCFKAIFPSVHHAAKVDQVTDSWQITQNPRQKIS